ncbi:unnamed protein product [Zymoseptoria tritici ST99CH_1E4]|uniref:Guanine nucleotide-exchange factor SEC12 n=1 Tax=Zymoseptoria tritici ST99CH_1E4 TaxID=1276532 RepID=A0A2H1GTB8_ZYMTR|nr:unnamed protein product [Zymoseptoria tritici ST99CH_1E4]
MVMAPKSNVSYAKHTLPYPIYAADWDPYNRGYLIVAGGGGEGRSGVPNQISVLDVSNRAAISTVADIDLSREEDSISSVANLATKDGLITFAGINSSQADQDAGKNEHFRAFGIRYPPRKKQKTEDEKSEPVKGNISLLGKRSLFAKSTAPKKETYQRLLRLSPVQKRDAPGKRIGAIASGLAKDSEVIVFNATVAIPEDRDIITRIALPEKAEAADLDIAVTPESDFSIAYCDDHNIYEQTYRYDFNKKKAEKRPVGPRRAYQMPVPEGFQDPRSRPKFRCLRFLNAENVVALVNKPNKGGAELRVYHLYPTGPAMELMVKTLPRRIKQASSIDVCAFDADKNGNQQFAVAVAGQDISIEIYTTNYQSATDTFSGMHSYLTLSEVHGQQMTKIVWSPFFSPPRASDPKDGKGEKTAATSTAPVHPGPQYARLASVSYGNTVVIDTFPLKPLEPQNKDSRYVLSHPKEERLWKLAYIAIITVIVVMVAMVLATFTADIAENPTAMRFLPPGARQYLVPSKDPITSTLTQTLTRTVQRVSPPTDVLRNAIDEHYADPEAIEATAIVVSDGAGGEGVKVDVNPDKAGYLEQDPHAKHWHELDDKQKSYWKEKLKAAGQWAEHEGESVLKGVLWSTYAQVAAEVIREL